MLNRAAVVACATLFAQNADVPTLRITVTLVQLDVVVTDKSGRHVAGLTKDDFRVFQDGKPQTITHFSYIRETAPGARPAPAPDLPARERIMTPTPERPRREDVRRTVALVVDDLGLSFTSTQSVRAALKRFVDHEMQPGDLVAIVRTGGGMGALQQFTTDKRLLHAAIDRMRWNGLGRAEASAILPLEFQSPDEELQLAEEKTKQFERRVFTIGTLGTLNYVVRGLRDLPGRKAVILFSDGFKLRSTPKDVMVRKLPSFDHTDRARQLADLANRAGVVMYTIDARGLASLTLLAQDLVGSAQDVARLLDDGRDKLIDQWEGLQYLAHETGGLFWKNTNGLAGAARAAAEDLSGYYLIGFNPGEGVVALGDSRNKYHRVKVTVTRPGLEVRSQNGYYGTPDRAAPPAPTGREPQLLAAIYSPFHSGDIRLHLTALFANAPEEGSYIDSLLHIDGRDLTFTGEADGWKKAVVDVLLLTFGDNGGVADMSNQTYTIRAKGKTWENAVRWGYLYRVAHPVKKPGAYQFRVAVRDATSEKVGSASQFIDVPDISKGRLALSGIVMQSSSNAEARNAPNAERNGGVEDPNGGPATRVFRRGQPIFYGFVVYNALIGPGRRRPEVEIQARVFRDGKQVWAGEPFSLAAATPADPQRMKVGQQLSFGSRTAPGEYLLQVRATDKLAKKMEAPAVQWMDFELK